MGPIKSFSYFSGELRCRRLRLPRDWRQQPPAGARRDAGRGARQEGAFRSTRRRPGGALRMKTERRPQNFLSLNEEEKVSSNSQSTKPGKIEINGF